MAISSDPNDPNFGLETDDTSPNFGLPAEEPQRGGIVQGITSEAKALAGQAVGLLNPINLARGVLDIQPRSGLQEVLRTGRMLRDIVGGASIQETLEKEAPEVAQQQQAILGVYGPEAQRETLTGIGTQLGMVTAPFIHGKVVPLREIAFGKPPPVPETPPAIPPQYAERRFTMVDTPPTETELAAVNRELAPVTEPPEATAVAPEPFPSITQSAEAQRRAELQQPQAPKVRQAISLDELRLMRERNELQLQNDLSKRATGSTHPAVEERLNQIDEELTTIANRELQTEGGGEISATKEGVIEEGGVPEYTGNGEGGPPAEAGGSGGVVPSTEVRGPRPTEETVTPEAAEPQPPAAAAPEKVQPGEFGEKGYTAVPTEEVPQKPSKIGQSIETKAVEAKLTQGFSETALYDPITIADQSRRAIELVKSSPEQARAVIRGEAPLPEGLRGTALITAMEENLLRKPDAKVAYELANSPLTSATSAAAQEMRLMSERVPDSIAAKFQEIRAARQAGSKLRGETPERVFQDIHKEIVRQSSKRPTWEQFVKEITCPV